eukprot:3270621-Pleurochrysis_carterae.AAC.1
MRTLGRLDPSLRSECARPQRGSAFSTARSQSTRARSAGVCARACAQTHASRRPCVTVHHDTALAHALTRARTRRSLLLSLDGIVDRSADGRVGEIASERVSCT